jgi:hypothetical protein
MARLSTFALLSTLAPELTLLARQSLLHSLLTVCDDPV